MAIRGIARIFIEPDDQYTTIVTSTEDGVSGTNLVSATSNQTLAAAFNKGRDDLSALATGGLKHREINITTRVS